MLTARVLRGPVISLAGNGTRTGVDAAGTAAFEMLFEIAQRLEAMALVFADPAFVNLVQRHRIQVMQFLAPLPDGGDQIRLLQQREML